MIEPVRVEAVLVAMAEAARRVIGEWAWPMFEGLEHLVQGEYEEALKSPRGREEWDVFV